MQHPEALRQEVISVVTAILRDLFIFCDDLIDDVIDPRFAWGELETLLEQALEQVRKLQQRADIEKRSVVQGHGKENR